MSIALYGGVVVLEFDEFVSHERPRGQIVGVQLEGSLEVCHSLFVVVPGEGKRDESHKMKPKR